MKLHILHCAAFCSAAITTHAQLTNGCFTIGGPADDVARAVVQTSDGGYAFAGSSFNMVKTDANGAVQWSNSYPNALDPNGSGGTDMIQTSDGGYAIVGTSTSASMGFVKLDASGAVQWSKQYDTADPSGTDDLYAVVQTPDGGYVLAGSGNNDVFGQYIMVVIKTDAAGGIEWSKAYEITGAQEAYDVVVASDGGYALCGYHDSGFLGNQLQVLRLDFLGNVLWAKGYGATVEVAHALAATPDSGFVVAGRTRSYGFDAFPLSDAFVMKLDPDGLVEWGHVYGDTTISEEFLGVVPTSDGGYAMAGRAVDGQIGIGQPRIFVAKCDASGELLWSQILNGVNQVGEAWDIIECTDGGLAVAGLEPIIGSGGDHSFMKMEADGSICPACGAEPYGRDSVAVLSGVDMSYMVYDNVAISADYTVSVLPGEVAEIGCIETGIEEMADAGAMITIAPNPADEGCIVSLDRSAEVGQLQLMTMQGSIVVTVETLGRERIEVPLDGLAEGAYILTAVGADRPGHARLVVAR